jgi:two-component system chemotaxis sensor kinase CheA
VERVVRLRRSEVKSVENQDTIVFGAQAVSLVRLQQVLELPPGPAADAADEFISAVVLGREEKRIAFAVDAVLQEQEVLVKGLGSLLARVRNVAGATVLGSGKPVLILNVPDLLKSATQAAGIRRLAAPAAALPASPREQSLLVVEDSITARMLLKNILESAGYRVKTAVDGMEGWTALKSEPFDLVVSDIQMPRLDGFNLTAKIRGDRKLSELPVILVTNLVSREDRERGIDVGANAYIVKRDFDQSNLLEVIHRLLG